MNAKTKVVTFIGAAVIILAIFAGCVSQTTPGAKSYVGSPTPESIQYAADWPLPNKDYANTRSTTGSSINSGNVNGLHVAWMYNISATGAFGALPTIPLILGNTVYFHDINANAYAVDLNTGSTKWTKIYNSTGLEGPFGVSIGYGKIFMQKDNFNIIALNLSNGNEVWSKKSIISAPLVLIYNHRCMMAWSIHQRSQVLVTYFMPVAEWVFYTL